MNGSWTASASTDVYKAIFETWRSQVDSYWQRSNYFAVFETAALAGCWSLTDHKHPAMGLLAAILGICLTVVWWCNNWVVHRYVDYWWKSLKDSERNLSLQSAGLAFASNHPGSGSRVGYRYLVQIIPGLFMVAWMALAAYGINSVRGAITRGGAMTSMTDLATILAATAGLWAIALAWLTYVMMTLNDNKRLFESLKSLVSGVRSELDLMTSWASPDTDGYSKATRPEDCAPNWRVPQRIIYKFGYDTIRGLPSSPYVYHLDDVGPFVRLSFSISRLFQYYDEYRTYALSRLEFYEDRSVGPMSQERQQYHNIIFDYNYHIHMDLIGGKDSPDEQCLYKAYKAAHAALNRLETTLKPKSLAVWFWLGHVIAALSFCVGAYLLYALFSK